MKYCSITVLFVCAILALGTAAHVQTQAMQRMARERAAYPYGDQAAAGPFPGLNPAPGYSVDLEQAVQRLAAGYRNHKPDAAAQDLEQAARQPAAEYRDHKPADSQLVVDVEHAMPDVIANLKQAVEYGQQQFASITALEPDEEPSDKNFIACAICKRTCSSACAALLSLKGTGFLCDHIICPKIVCKTVCD